VSCAHFFNDQDALNLWSLRDDAQFGTLTPHIK
jgi:hypothetical protein